MNLIPILLKVRNFICTDGITTQNLSLPVLFGALSLLLSTLIPSTSMATPCQERLCSIGMNLGYAYGRLYYFGKAYGGTPPPDQVTAMAANLRNASAEIDAFEDNCVSPLYSSARRDETVRLIRDNIAALANRAATLTFNDAHRIKNIKGQYRRGLSYAYSNNRKGLKFGGTCDTYHLDACYQFEASHVAAAINPPDRQTIGADYGQSHHVEMMRSAINDGISLSFDNITGVYDPAKGIEYPSSGGVIAKERICCYFGEEAGWRPILALARNSAWVQFTDMAPTLLEFIRDIPPPDNCASGKPNKPISCKRVVGKWKWGDHGTVVIRADNSTQHMVGNEVRNTGTWNCKDGKVQIDWSKGGWVDTVTVMNDGNTLEGHNQKNHSIKATKMQNNQPTGTGRLYFVATPPYGGGEVCLSPKGVARLRNSPIFRPLNKTCNNPGD